jgi:hypothetical protein
MPAQVFNPTETKKNGPATRPAIAPARRVTFLFNAGWVVLAGTAQSYCDTGCTVNRCWLNLWLRGVETRSARKSTFAIQIGI